MQLLNGGAVTGQQMAWPAGDALFSVCGTFAGAAIALQVLGPDGKTYITLGSYSGAAAAVFRLPACSVRAAVTPATGRGAAAPALFASLLPLADQAVTNNKGEAVTNSTGAEVLNS